LGRAAQVHLVAVLLREVPGRPVVIHGSTEHHWQRPLSAQRGVPGVYKVIPEEMAAQGAQRLPE